MDVEVKIVVAIDELKLQVKAKPNEDIDDPADFLSRVHEVMQALMKDVL